MIGLCFELFGSCEELPEVRFIWPLERVLLRTKTSELPMGDSLCQYCYRLHCRVENKAGELGFALINYEVFCDLIKKAIFRVNNYESRQKF